MLFREYWIYPPCSSHLIKTKPFLSIKNTIDNYEDEI